MSGDPTRAFGDFFGMLEEVVDAAKAPHERIGKDHVNGLVVSTVLTKDMGWETAIIDANGTSPVQRYLSKEAAVDGHERWKEFALDGERITRLGYGELVEPTEIVLKRIAAPEGT